MLHNHSFIGLLAIAELATTENPQNEYLSTS